MKKKNLIIKNCIKKKYLKNKRFHSFSKNFEKIISDIKFKSNSPLEIYNLLNKNYKFNFKTSDLKIFKRFKSIAIIATMLTFYIQASFTEKDYAKSKDVKSEVENHFNWKLFLVLNLIPIIEFLQHIYKKYNKSE